MIFDKVLDIFSILEVNSASMESLDEGGNEGMKRQNSVTCSF